MTMIQSGRKSAKYALQFLNDVRGTCPKILYIEPAGALLFAPVTGPDACEQWSLAGKLAQALEPLCPGS